MTEKSHYVSGYRTLAFQLKPEVQKCIDAEISLYRERCRREGDMKKVARGAVQAFAHFDKPNDTDDFIGSSGRRAALVGLMNALCEYRYNKKMGPTTCLRLQQLCPSLRERIERIYTLLDPNLNCDRLICGFDPIEQLGVGGHGTVFEVKVRSQLKALKFALWDTIEAKLIEHEDTVLTQLDSLPEAFKHRVLLDSKFIDEDPIHAGLLMPLVAGRNLQSYLEFETAKWEHVRTMGFELLELIFEIHKLGFIHMDLKPANICLRSPTDSDDDADLADPVLIDFGLALKVDTGNQPIAVLKAIGWTEAFASPEQRDNQKIGSASDIYSFGGVLGYALTGIEPIETERFEKRLTQYAKEHPRSLPLVSAIQTAVSKAPENRFANAGEFRDAIWPQMSPRAIRRRKRLKRMAAVCAVFAVILGIWRYFGAGQLGPPTWIDRLQDQHKVELANYGIDQLRFLPDFLEYERAGYYKSGFLTIQAPAELGPFIRGLEVKFDDGPWTAPMSVSDAGAGYTVSSEQIRDQLPLKLRFDSVPGEGVGRIYGEVMETQLDLEAVRERQLSEWRENRRYFEQKADEPQYVFKFADGWKPTDALLDQAWEIRDIVLYEEATKDSPSVSLHDLYLETGAYVEITDVKDQLATMCNCMPDEYRHSPLLHFVIEYRADPNLWEDEFWKLHRIHTLNRMVLTGEAPKITDGRTEYIVPEMIDEKNKLVATMVKGYSAGHWEFTDEFIEKHASVIAEIYFTTTVFGEEKEPRYQLAKPQDKPTKPSAWTEKKRFYVGAGHYDATCIYIRAVFIDGTSSEHIRHRVEPDTEYFDQRRWIAISYDAPEILRRDVDIGEQLRYIKSAELQRINYGK